MSGVTGRTAAIAFAKFGANSWGVAASVTRGAHFDSDGGLTPQPVYVEDESMNQGFRRRGEVGDFTAPDVTFTGRARYEDHHYVLEACCMGSPAAPVLVSSQAANSLTAYRHIIDLAPAIDGLGVTVAVDKVRFVDELTAAKVYGFSLGFTDGGVVAESFKLMGSKPTPISSINTRSTVHGASYPDFGNRVFRKQGTFRLNAQGGGSLVAADAVAIETFDFEFSRPQDAPHVTGQDFIAEPQDNGFPDPLFRVTFPRMTTLASNSLYGHLTSGNQLKGDLTFVGPNINSTTAAQLQMQFPALEVQEWSAALTGANQVKPTASFRLKEVATAPTGMTGVTRPFRITRVMNTSLSAF